jgi:hypothetical protein
MGNGNTPSDADLVWNRAAAHRGEGPGDHHLRALLLMHGAVMNGGPEHAASSLDGSEIDAAAAGGRYFGLDDLAAIVERLPAAEGDEELDGHLSGEYLALVPDDTALFDAFAARYAASPSDFQPASR